MVTTDGLASIPEYIVEGILTLWEVILAILKIPLFIWSILPYEVKIAIGIIFGIIIIYLGFWTYNNIDEWKKRYI